MAPGDVLLLRDSRKPRSVPLVKVAASEGELQALYPVQAPSFPKPRPPLALPLKSPSISQPRAGNPVQVRGLLWGGGERK